jgi:hypothetical protein
LADSFGAKPWIRLADGKPMPVSSQPGALLRGMLSRTPLSGEQMLRMGAWIRQTGEQMPQTGQRMRQTGQQLWQTGDQMSKSGDRIR